MSETNPSILSHVSIGTNDFEATSTLYAKVLATLGCREIMRHPGAVAFGRDLPVSYRVWSPKSGYPGHADYRDFHIRVEHRESLHAHDAVAYASRDPGA